MSRRVATMAVLGLVLLAASGCAAVRNGLGTRVGICFAALPAARQVVGQQASFAGVRYLRPRAVMTAIAKQLGEKPLAPPDALADVVRKPACLVAYRGPAGHRLERQAWRPERGRPEFTIVVVRQSDHKVIGVMVLPRAPLGFSHVA